MPFKGRKEEKGKGKRFQTRHHGVVPTLGEERRKGKREKKKGRVDKCLKCGLHKERVQETAPAISIKGAGLYLTEEGGGGRKRRSEKEKGHQRKGTGKGEKKS